MIDDKLISYYYTDFTPNYIIVVQRPQSIIEAGIKIGGLLAIF